MLGQQLNSVSCRWPSLFLTSSVISAVTALQVVVLSWTVYILAENFPVKPMSFASKSHINHSAALGRGRHSSSALQPDQTLASHLLWIALTFMEHVCLSRAQFCHATVRAGRAVQKEQLTCKDFALDSLREACACLESGEARSAVPQASTQRNICHGRLSQSLESLAFLMSCLRASPGLSCGQAHVVSRCEHLGSGGTVLVWTMSLLATWPESGNLRDAGGQMM